MLVTPLGQLRLFVNDKEVEFKAEKKSLDRNCSSVTGRYLIQYQYKKNNPLQKIKCCISSLDVDGIIESGERLEAISFYKDFTKLTLGIEASFGGGMDYGYDYSGSYLSNGIEYETHAATDDQIFQFGVSWIRPYKANNEHETWYGADPSLMRLD